LKTSRTSFNSFGFTLVEVLVSILLTVVIISVLFVSFKVSVNNLTALQSSTNEFSKFVKAFGVIEKDISNMFPLETYFDSPYKYSSLELSSLNPTAITNKRVELIVQDSSRPSPSGFSWVIYKIENNKLYRSIQPLPSRAIQAQYELLLEDVSEIKAHCYVYDNLDYYTSSLLNFDQTPKLCKLELTISGRYYKKSFIP